MNRVIVIGSGGAGTSTLAPQIGEILGLPVIHLDREFWRPNWMATPEDEWIERVRELVARERWVMDGNFGGTMDIRIAACDTVVYLDFPRILCTYRVLKRWITYRRGTRPDMGEGCPEKFDLEFLDWVWNFSARSRQRIETRLAASLDGKRLYRLTSPKEVDRFVAELKAAGR